MTDVKRDSNYVTTLAGVDISTLSIPTPLAVDETNNRLLVSAIITAGGGSGGDGAIVDGVSAAIKATVFDLTNSNPLATQIVDANGDAITSFGGGTQYADGAVQATPTGTVALGYDGANVRALTTDVNGYLQVDVLTLPAVTATDLDIRNLVFATDKVDASGSILGANSGVDIGDVTINNASGAAAVNIQDGGNSITVDGTVAISGSVAVTGTFFQATQPISAAALPLPTGAATAALQTQPGVDIGDVTINNAAGASAVNIQDGGNSITVDGTVAISGTVTTKETRSATPGQTSPAMSTTTATILASNANRLGATIYNEGSATVLMKLGATASATSYTCQIASGGYYEVPFGYTGVIDGITASGTATLRVTELT